MREIIFAGFEISDVLAINDKDYSITFGLYFSVEWLEPRLNLSKVTNYFGDYKIFFGWQFFSTRICGPSPTECRSWSWCQVSGARPRLGGHRISIFSFSS